MSVLETIKERLTGDPAVKLVSNDPALTAELLLLFRVMLADGLIKEEEVAMFKRICSDAFGLDPDHMDGVYQYLQDFAYEMTAKQATDLFRDQPLERRKLLLDHMIAIAEADADLDVNEVRVLHRTSDILGFDLKSG
ncbi:MAG: TerB family tellurite resistance protein [Pseudomonadota bacterium]